MLIMKRRERVTPFSDLVSFWRRSTRHSPVQLLCRSLTILALTCGSIAHADVVNLGVVSLDEVVPGAFNGFSVSNFSSSFSLPPDFPAINPVIFQNARLILTEDVGTVLPPVLLGDLESGTESPSTLEFLVSRGFQSAEFLATVMPETLKLSTGKLFLADTNAIDTFLLPGSGSTLVAGSDFAVISVNGTIADASVPEPASWLLLTTIASLIALHKRTTVKTRKNPEP